MHFLGLTAYVVGWLKGGHPERFGATALLIAYALSSITYRWRIGDFYWASAAEDLTLMLIMGWLALRSPRWWPFVVAAALALIMTIHGLTILNPALSSYAAASAHVGLWIVIDTALLFGVLERWLAGERAVSGQKSWRRKGPGGDLDRDRWKGPSQCRPSL